MKTLKITLQTGNAAFTSESDDAFESVCAEKAEVARILRHLADCLEDNGLEGQRLFDVNGNAVGRLEVEGDQPKANRSAKMGM
jgi:hypothetical protein